MFLFVSLIFLSDVTTCAYHNLLHSDFFIHKLPKYPPGFRAAGSLTFPNLVLFFMNPFVAAQTCKKDRRSVLQARRNSIRFFPSQQDADHPAVSFIDDFFQRLLNLELRILRHVHQFVG